MAADVKSRYAHRFKWYLKFRTPYLFRPADLKTGGPEFTEEAKMGIAKRVFNIFKADIHGMMDQLEDKGLLLKQYLREMKEALELKEIRLKKLESLTRLRDDIEGHIVDLDHQIDQFKGCIDQQRIQYEQLKVRATEYFHQEDQKEWKKTLSTFTPARICPSLSDEEIEFELIRRKQAFSKKKGGIQK
jgi:phage shock protein A